MKKIFNFAAVTFVALFASSAFAQQDQASTQLKVNLGNSYEITVAQPLVEINMNTPQHFQAGNNSGVKANHVQVSATGDYEVTVKASQDLTLASSSETIPVNTINVTPVLGSYLGGGTDPGAIAVTLTEKTLQVNTENTIISTDTGESLRGYNILYTIPSAKAEQYVNHSPGTYATTVTYSLYAQ